MLIFPVFIVVIFVMTTSASAPLSKASWLRSFKEKVSLKDGGSNIHWPMALQRILSLKDAASRFFNLRLEVDHPVSPHVLNMIEHLKTLERFGCPIPKELAVNQMLDSLHDGFAQFRENYKMNVMEKSLQELHSLLVEAERDMPLSGSTERDVFSIGLRETFKAKKRKREAYVQGKGKCKAIVNSNAKPKVGKHPDARCFYCNGFGHWKRNCPLYLEDKKAGRVTPRGMTSSKLLHDKHTLCLYY